MNELRRALVRLTVGIQPTEELPDLAARALAEGIDVPALRELAGLGRADVHEARGLFLAAMEQLGVEELHSLWDVVRFWAAEIVAGNLMPYEGARLIWIHVALELNNPDPLTPFVGLADAWEQDPDNRQVYEREIVDEARRLAGQPHVDNEHGRGPTS